mmetsp:Transcript_6922/g.17718  ORF Transcript_6922/g.17718 Transcript_6922/m.17718 type:complete len:256 (-) Transcript_6922:794-1561(-)
MVRTSVASFMKAVRSAAMSLASVIWAVSRPTVALASSSFASSSPIFCSLSVLEVLVFSSSMSHQFLCSSSSVCSAMRRKIIFWIMLLTSSNGPLTRAATCSAKRSKLLDFSDAASLRSRFTAFCLGSTDEAEMAMKAPGAASVAASAGATGGSGFEGASVRTPVALLRIWTAASMASISLARMLDRSAHSDFFMVQDFLVSPSVVSSAARSLRAFPRSLSAALRSLCTVPSSVSFCVLAAVAAAIAASRAFLARL